MAIDAAAISSSACIVLHAEVLELRQLVEDVRRRRDRVAGVDERQLGLLRRRRRGPNASAVLPIDVAVGAGRERRRLDLEGMVEQLGGLAEVAAGLERRDVGVADLVALGA